jgi:predicted Ser/Thr protein kinase
VAAFLQSAKDEFAQIFHEELLSAMSLIDKEQHATLLARYVEHVVASLKKEKIYNPTTQSHEPPSESLMSEVEKLLGVTSSVSDHRQGLLARLAAWRLENKSKALDLSLVFAAERRKIERHYFDEKEELINATRKAMLALDTDEAKHFAPRELELARATYKELERRFHYTSEAARKLVAATFSRNPQ